MSNLNLKEETSYLFGANSTFVEELYERYQREPSSVDASWANFFASLGDDMGAIVMMNRGASWSPRSTKVIGGEDELAGAAGQPANDSAIGNMPEIVLGSEVIEHTARDSVRALLLIHAYRFRGHLIADLDPLKLDNKKYHPELDPSNYGFVSDGDLDREIFIGGELGMQTATMRQILAILRQTYCSNIGAEFMHIQFPEQREWIQQKIEHVQGKPQLSRDEKKQVLKVLNEVHSFEEFLQVKYTGTKRFSIQGGDATLSAIETVLITATDNGVDECVIGMPHRGRINVLTTIMGKPYLEILSLFHGNLDFPEWVESSGDVKYHLGASSDRVLANGKEIHLSLTANPSHLEAVNPVVVGKVRAKQQQKQDKEKSKTMAIMLHGDASFAGQGSVAETLSLSELKGYRTGGTIHIIVNNQIGFTTSPKYSRFTPYPSDVAKMVQAPIFHVNGDDPEAVSFVCKMATEFRQKFKRDVVIDIICYRKYGHNESDEPLFTQPKMYREIKNHKPVSQLYAEQLLAQNIITKNELDEQLAEFKKGFEAVYETAKEFKPNKADWLEGEWEGFQKPQGEHPDGDTGIDAEKLKMLGQRLADSGPGEANRKIIRQLEAKKKMLESGEGFDWAMGEALAYASLLSEGHPVRLSGQDSGRGTFSHRHSVLVDQDDEKRYIPLNNLHEGQEKFEVIDSNLSEFAILGFEYGYSMADPNALVLWEAQFGDFANGAQVIIDQFISSGEIKWLRMSGLVMLLPHGYEGQGPEHSSARLERYLQLCAEDNMQIANCTTPANYFHILRRQLKRDFRKPLIIMTPKSLLRHKLAVSKLDEFLPGTSFQRVIPEIDQLTSDNKVRKLLLCSGKVYYDLLEARREKKIDDVAIIRVEQLYPLPERELAEQFNKYKNADIIWVQEEPRNMGSWGYIVLVFDSLMEQTGRTNQRVHYVGRTAAASPATGYLKIHQLEQKKLVDEALS